MHDRAASYFWQRDLHGTRGANRQPNCRRDLHTHARSGRCPPHPPETRCHDRARSTRALRARRSERVGFCSRIITYPRAPEAVGAHRHDTIGASARKGLSAHLLSSVAGNCPRRLLRHQHPPSATHIATRACHAVHHVTSQYSAISGTFFLIVRGGNAKRAIQVGS